MMLVPSSPEELAAQLADANSSAQSISLGGNFTKAGMGGPLAASKVTISAAKLNRVLQYEPRDLTISVEAGITFRELSRVLAEHRQMIPLDPHFSEDATVGGILAANASGPRRRLYGTARDMVIGMTFATLEGKLVRTGGMVVKNVAGLDMGKLMIGSFGTLAAIATVNFRVHPTPPATRTFILESEAITDVITARDALLKGQLQPSSIDILKSGGSYRLMIQAGGSAAVLDRYSRELTGAQVLQEDAERDLWHSICELTPRFLCENIDGAVLRMSCALSEVGRVLDWMPATALARAGSGVCYGYFPHAEDLALFTDYGPGAVVEFAPQSFREKAGLWPVPGSDFEMMKKIKDMFDPRSLLNRGRLYGRI
jgi:glycolate dehydrogenase FAD-binding subunit